MNDEVLSAQLDFRRHFFLTSAIIEILLIKVSSRIIGRKQAIKQSAINSHGHGLLIEYPRFSFIQAFHEFGDSLVMIFGMRRKNFHGFFAQTFNGA